MKKLIYLFILGIGFTSCSVESIDSTENLLTADLSATENSNSFELVDDVLCAGEVPSFNVDFPQNTNGQGKTDVKIQIETTPDTWIAFMDVTYYDAGPKTITYTNSLPVGNYNFRASVGSGGFVFSDSLVVEPCTPCENSLEVNLVCGSTNTATFTFTAEEAGPIVIQGGLTNGTTINSATSADLTRNIEHSSVLNSNSNVTRWEGDLVACDEVSVTITFSGGNGIGDWSAKRGEEVLGKTEELACNNN